MTAIDVARANVAAVGLERCLRIIQGGSRCDRLWFPVARRKTRSWLRVDREPVLNAIAGLPFIAVLIALGLIQLLCAPKH